MVDKISYMNAHAETPAEQHLRSIIETKTEALQKEMHADMDAHSKALKASNEKHENDLKDSNEKFEKDLKDCTEKFEKDLKDVYKSTNKQLDDCFDDIRRDLRELVATFERLFQHSEETLAEIQRIKSDFSAHLTGVNEKCLEIKSEFNSEPLKADEKTEVSELKQSNIVLQQNNVALQQNNTVVKQENKELKQENTELKKENTDLKSKLAALIEYIKSFFSSPRNKNVSINDSRDAFFAGSKNTLVDSHVESAPSHQATI